MIASVAVASSQVLQQLFEFREQQETMGKHRGGTFMRTNPVGWLGLALVVLIAASLLSVGASQLIAHHREWQQLDDRLAKIPEAAQIDMNSSPVASVDFTARLPPASDIQSILVDIQARSADGGVQTLSVRIGHRLSTAEALGRTDVSLTLKGTYPNLKRLVADVLERYSHITLRHLELKRSAQGSDAEADVLLGVWSRPVERAGLNSETSSAFAIR